MQGKRQKTDHFDPVVALVQMGALVREDLGAGLLGHTGGDVNFRLDETQNKGGQVTRHKTKRATSECVIYFLDRNASGCIK